LDVRCLSFYYTIRYGGIDSYCGALVLRGWSLVEKACIEDPEECRDAVRRFLENMCSDRGWCIEEKPRLLEKYRWIEQLIKTGVPDGRSRLILYVISRYLVNIKGLDTESAEILIEEFIDNSCRNHGNCSKIYKSWIRNVVRRVKEGGWYPWSLERIKERDPELYNILANTLKIKG